MNLFRFISVCLVLKLKVKTLEEKNFADYSFSFCPMHYVLATKMPCLIMRRDQTIKLLQISPVYQLLCFISHNRVARSVAVHSFE